LNNLFKHDSKEFKFFGGDIETFFQFCKTIYSKRMIKESVELTSNKTLQKYDLNEAFKIFEKMRDEENELPISVQMMYR